MGDMSRSKMLYELVAGYDEGLVRQKQTNHLSLQRECSRN